MEKKSKVISKAVSGFLLCTMATYTIPAFAFTKDETVYSKLNENGESYNTVVSTHLTNSDSESVLNDVTDLFNIKNTNGDETFSQDGNSLKWNADGKDIYYQGESQKELPIDCKVTYTLDGKEVDANDIVGKSGKISIKIEYTNKDSHSVNINGEMQTLYTPFVVMAGTIVNNDNNKNITISNGKTVDNGTKTVVAGMAMPGLQESLGISKDEINIPDSIEITMDSTDFELNSIISYVTPKVIDKDDISNFDQLDEIFDKVSELQDASKQLVSGSNQLNDGIQTLNSSVGTLSNGANQLANGTSQLANGTSEVANNMSKITSGASELANGQKNLSNGLQLVQSKLPSETTINTNRAQLNQLKTNNQATIAKLNLANSNIDKTLSESNKKLASIESSLNSLKAQGIYEDSIANLKIQLQQWNANPNGKEDKIGKLSATISLYESLAGSKQLVTLTISSLNEQKAGNTGLISLIGYNEATVESSLNSLDEMEELNAGISNLYAGSNKLQAGVDKLQMGSSQIQTGVNKLASASKQLESGAQVLSNGTIQLKDGTNKIAEGSSELAEGINKFDSEGIEKICNYINGDAKDLKTRIEKLSDLAESYNKFTMSNDGTQSSVKFIMIIDELKKDKDESSDKQMLTTDELNENTDQSTQSNNTTTSSN